METGDEIPTLLQLMFGETAETALRGASPRLLLWCRAFDGWLAERERQFKPSIRKASVLAWRRLYQNTKRMPWELRPEDIARHAERMKEQGLAPTTIYADLGMLSIFFCWCAEKGSDPACEPFFNPAASVTRQNTRGYGRARLLSRREVERLLQAIQADRSPLGLREYAFTLARLHTGVRLNALQRLQWGQIEADESGARVRWRPEREPVPLAEEAWEAIQDFLTKSGRLPEMREDSYLFTPLVDPTDPEAGRKAEDWAESHLSNNQILKNVKLYGRLAGIPEEKLNQEALRLTAARLRLEAGRGGEGNLADEMQAFQDSRSSSRLVDYRLNLLPPLPEDPPEAGQADRAEVAPPNRKPRRFQPGDNYVHGFSARSHPPEEIEAVLAEDIRGVEEQIVALRLLGRSLTERGREALTRAESARLQELYAQVAGWLDIVIRSEEQLAAGSHEQSQVDDFLEGIRRLCEQQGETFDREALLAEALGSDPGLDLNSRQLREEVATLRYNLRSAFAQAMETLDADEYARLVQHYGRGCVRLARLLRRGKVDYGRVKAYIDRSIDEAVEQTVSGWALFDDR